MTMHINDLLEADGTYIMILIFMAVAIIQSHDGVDKLTKDVLQNWADLS